MRGGSSIFEPSTGPKVLKVPRRPVPKGLGENAFFARLRPVGACIKSRTQLPFEFHIRKMSGPGINPGSICDLYPSASSFLAAALHLSKDVHCYCLGKRTYDLRRVER